MNLLHLWNDTFVLALVLVTVVLAVACSAASRLRMSAARRNGVLLPALIFTLIVPLAMAAARASGWAIPLPLLVLETGSTPVLAQGQEDGTVFPSTWVTELFEAQTVPMDISAPSSRLVVDKSASIARWVTVGLVLVWAVGSVICLVRLGRSYVSLWRLLANASPVSHPHVDAAAVQAATALGLTSYPTVLVSDQVSSPVAVGTPRYGWVIWPHGSLGERPHEQLVHVLMHEGAHIVHRDTPLRLLQGIVVAVWWWHPLVYLLNLQLSRTREELCDNVVISSVDPVHYGRTLLDIGRPRVSHRSPALAVTLFPEHEHLEHRIRSILNPRRKTMNRSKPHILISACIAGFAMSALAGATQVTDAERRQGVSLDARWASHNDRTLVKEFTLTFEDTSMPRHLDIDIKRGDILVTAYDAEDVIVRLAVPKEESKSADETRDGFRRYSGKPLDFKVRQNGNTIELDGNSYEQTTHVEVLVPRQLDLTLDSYTAGVISVTGVEGTLRARSQDNDIVLVDVAGSADVYGYNGSFRASFREVAGPLKFETYNGSVDLTLPIDIQATTFLRAERQDVRSQFTIAERPANLMLTENNDGSASIEYSKYTVGDINEGGAHVVIETTNGVILLRKP